MKKKRRVTMRKSMLLLIPMVLLIVSCGLKLSDNDAKAIIEKELAYPKGIRKNKLNTMGY